MEPYSVKILYEYVHHIILTDDLIKHKHIKKYLNVMPSFGYKLNTCHINNILTISTAIVTTIYLDRLRVIDNRYFIDNIFNVTLITLLIGHQLEDNPYTTSYFSKIIIIKSSAINKIRFEILDRIDYRLFINTDVYLSYVENLHHIKQIIPSCIQNKLKKFSIEHVDTLFSNVEW